MKNGILLTYNDMNSFETKAMLGKPYGNELVLIWLQLRILAKDINKNGALAHSTDEPITLKELSSIIDFKIDEHAQETYSKFDLIEYALYEFEMLGLIKILADEEDEDINNFYIEARYL